jgi:hypothetical protein
LTLIQVPTSLLAQVDSSVGGKVAINLPRGKNLVGTFYQPALVLADLDCLRTLEDRQWRAGMAEVIKYGAIRDAAPNDIPGLIERCPDIRVVLLNGTTAHALFKKLLPPLAIDYVMLPSTSPANTMAYAKKRAAWAEQIPLKEKP